MLMDISVEYLFELWEMVKDTPAEPVVYHVPTEEELRAEREFDEWENRNFYEMNKKYDCIDG